MVMEFDAVDIFSSHKRLMYRGLFRWCVLLRLYCPSMFLKAIENIDKLICGLPILAEGEGW